MYTYIKIGGDGSPYAYRYENLTEQLRPKTNEELYEGWMRSDFSNKKVFERTADSVVVVKLDIGA